MLAFALLALLHITLLPGLLITTRLRFGSLAERIVAVVVLSLLSTQLLVELLVAVDQYRHSTLLVIMALQLVALWRLTRASRAASGLGQAHAIEPPSSGMIVAHTCMALCLALHVGLWIAQWGTVFLSHDAIASWNRWATEWAGNRWPTGTWNYPQLLPCAWSLVYAMSGSAMTEPWARALMGVFPCLMLLVLWDLLHRQRQPWLAVAAAILSGLLITGFHTQRWDGMADVPVAALTFAGIFFLILARGAAGAPSATQPASSAAQPLALAAVSFAAAAQTKQAGLMMMALALLWCATDATLRRQLRQIGKPVLWAVAGMLVVALHSYAVRWLVQGETDAQLVGYLTHDIHAGRTLWQRVLHGLSVYRGQLLLGWLGSTAVMALLIAALWHALGRRVLLHFALPYLVLWLLAYSYDARNSACAIPPLALACGYGAAVLATRWPLAWAWLKPLLARCGGAPRLGLAAAVLLLLGLALVPKHSVDAAHKDACRRAGDPMLNRMVARHVRDQKGKLLSANLYLRLQPTLRHRTTVMDEEQLFAARDSATTGVHRLAEFHWLVLPAYLPSEYAEQRNELLTSGQIRELEQSPGWVLYAITKSP